MKLDELKEMTTQLGGELKPNTKNVYYGVGGENKNNAWVENIYYENDVLMIKFLVSVPAKDWGYDWAFCTDKAENFFNSIDFYENEVEGTKFEYSIDDINKCVEDCRKYYNWYINKDKPYIVSFG